MFYIISTFITNVLIMNMLVSLMGEYHTVLSEYKGEVELKAQVAIMAQHSFLLPSKI